ncbi:hypothetical protein AVEN_130330-1 [Araneus ventricosus]|uniref:Uncharacterized protein n=1 Tax=Araneus ventricosus TaxID=182803 RepID=A0A4Y2BFQ6_ARAVE|nr:hypothetical protein AVEN_130330-1 [Araneus ventricosus]
MRYAVQVGSSLNKPFSPGDSMNGNNSFRVENMDVCGDFPNYKSIFIPASEEMDSLENEFRISDIFPETNGGVTGFDFTGRWLCMPEAIKDKPVRGRA